VHRLSTGTGRAAGRSRSSVQNRRAESRPEGGFITLDLLFVGVSVLFSVVSIGYVAACDRLMK
jgi:hypothetical protein